MSKLWIFGDSFSCEWTDVVSPGHKEYAQLYKPSHFSEEITQNLNITSVVNKAVSGYCNYSILESIGKEVGNISKNDYVVVGWSEITRWRSTTIHDNKWTIVAPNFIKPYIKKISHLYKYECAGRDNILTVQELNSWINILKLALPKNNIQWTPFQYQQFKYKLNLETPNFKISTIREEVGIKDYHTTSQGHKNIGKWLVKLFNNNFDNQQVI